MKHVRILTIGNEVLLGAVLDSNSNWLCKQISGLGGQVTRICVLPDEVEKIAAELRSDLASGASLILTVGGLGPTADDLTLSAVAAATDCPLMLEAQAIAFVKGRYDVFYRNGSVDSAEMTPEREKMAYLPQGAVPLANSVGAAPGVLLRINGGQIVVSLPGVPSELKDIFCNAFGDTLLQLFGSGGYVERTVVTDCKDESVLARLLREVCQSCPDVYIKSRPKRFGSDVRMQITLARRSDSVQSATIEVDNAQASLEKHLGAVSIKILEVKTA